MTDRSEQRDKIIARLAGQSLRAGTKVDSACPDPELLAAYADHYLTADETREWEAHFAACPKCQKLLALLAISTDETSAPQESKLRDTSLIPSSPADAPHTRQSPAKQSHWSKHWLAPVLAAAAVLTLWLVLRPALTPTSTQTTEVARVTAPATPASNSPAANAPPQNEIAQAQIPAPPATASPAPKQRESSSESDRENARDLEQLKVQAEKDTPRALTAAQPSSVPPQQPGAANAASTSAEIQAAVPPASVLPAPAAPHSAQQAVTVTTEIPVLETERTVRSADATSAARSAGPVAAIAGAAGAPSSFSNQTVAGLAKEAAPGVTFAAGDGPMWRVGPAGSIERSNDKGTTWQPQASSVKADLLAGTAVSAQVAWVVGRQGVILRTTDGQTWQRVAPPNRLMVDWTNIQATDANHASIKSSDDRSFRTADGGHTWTAQ